jgi:hypothetical protein
VWAQLVIFATMTSDCFTLRFCTTIWTAWAVWSPRRGFSWIHEGRGQIYEGRCFTETQNLRHASARAVVCQRSISPTWSLRFLFALSCKTNSRSTNECLTNNTMTTHEMRFLSTRTKNERGR